MRLLFINRYFHPDISATAQLLTELAEDLSAKGESITVITGNNAYTESSSRLPHQETYNGILILRVGSTRFGRARMPAGPVHRGTQRVHSALLPDPARAAPLAARD